MDFARALDELRDGADPAGLASAIVAAMTEDERLGCLEGSVPFWAGVDDLQHHGYHRRPFPAAAVPRLGVPGFAFADGPRGVVVDHATCFPVSMARGATWDPSLEEAVGEVIGRELRAVGATLYGGVCVNLLRHPAWGRAQETYGEDPFHVGELGAALTRGVQRHAMAVVKHFACNSMENMRFKVDVEVDEVSLHEVFLPHFRRVVDEGVAVVMSAYNQVNGEWCGESRALLTNVLRHEWGFRGFVISDWIFGLRDGARSVTAGLDVEMPYRMVRHEHLRSALAAGDVTWAEVDRCVAATVATLLRFHPLAEVPAEPRSVLQRPEHRQLAREVAVRATVLLRNEPVGDRPLLPLDPRRLTSVALCGPLGTAVNLGDGGSSDVWADDVVTPRIGLAAALPDARLTVVAGDDPVEAAAAAAGADVAVVVVGSTSLDEGEYIDNAGTAHLGHLFPGPDDPAEAAAFEAVRAADPPVEVPDRPGRDQLGFAPGGDRAGLRLPDRQVALIRAVAAANPATVVVLQGGSAFVIAEWDGAVPAVLHTWYPGGDGGHALADVLLGHREPGGRLPLSIPRHEDDLPPFDRLAERAVYGRYHGWWHLEHQGTEAAYPFGFGLTYTTFEVGAPRVRVDGATVRVTVPVRNTGARDGRPLVQLYAQRQGAGAPRRLVGFARPDLPAGTAVEVAVAVAVASSSLAERDPDRHEMVVRPGAYRLWAAQHAGERPDPVGFTLGAGPRNPSGQADP
jgi:beta-glucosidase